MAPRPIQHALDRAPRRGAAGARTAHLAAEPRLGSRPQPTVLILFSDTGGGHRAAAGALDGALRRIDPEVRITWNDPLIGQGRAVARRIGSLYPTIIKRSPTTWGAIFHSSNTAASFAAVRATLGAQIRVVLERQLAAVDPDVVLSVHPLLNHVTAALLRRGPRRRGLMTVVTDLVALHRGWACRQADVVVVPTDQALVGAMRLGVPATRLRELGMPVDLRFRAPKPGEASAIRRRLGLEGSRPVVLVGGGGEGTGGLLDQVQVLAETPHPWQVIAVCGRNERLRHRLVDLRFATPTLVLGFVDDMPDLLRASDLVVGKAGPGAIAEAVSTGVPLLLTSYLPGQERGNVRFVTEAGIGRYVPRPDRLLDAVSELLLGDPETYEQLRRRTAALARPTAALDIAGVCLRLCAYYSAASQASR